MTDYSFLSIFPVVVKADHFTLNITYLRIISWSIKHKCDKVHLKRRLSIILHIYFSIFSAFIKSKAGFAFFFTLCIWIDHHIMGFRNVCIDGWWWWEFWVNVNNFWFWSSRILNPKGHFCVKCSSNIIKYAESHHHDNDDYDDNGMA